MQQGPGVGPAEGPTGGPNKPNVTYILEEDKKRRLSDHLQVRILVKSNVSVLLEKFYRHFIYHFLFITLNVTSSSSSSSHNKSIQEII